MNPSCQLQLDHVLISYFYKVGALRIDNFNDINYSEKSIEISFEKIVLYPHIYIDTKNGIYDTESLSVFNVNGWLKTAGRKDSKICIQLKDKSVKEFFLNKARSDVKTYLEKMYQIAFPVESGFSLVEDISCIEKIGYSEGQSIRWEYNVKFKSAKNNTLKVILGPSHIYRIEFAIKHNLIPEIKGRYKLVRKGGMPIWSHLVSDELKYESKLDLFFIVGDFRFGNEILENEILENENYPRLDRSWHYSGIKKNLINYENDSLLYRMCTQKISDIVNLQQGKTRFLFWDLSIREYENKAKEKYVKNGAYRHPVWNYADSERLFAKNIVGSKDILDDGGKLYIDSSAHPSMLGFAYLLNKINDDGPFDIADRQKALTDALHAQFILATGDAPIHSIGASTFVKYMLEYSKSKTIPMPNNFTFELTDQIRDIAPKEHVLYFLPIRSFKLKDERISYFISLYMDQLKFLRTVHGKVSVIPYDNWACEVISQKHQYKDWYSPKSNAGKTETIEKTLCDDSQNFRISHITNPHKLLEINHVLSPNLYGVMEIYMRLTSDFTRLDVERSYEAVVHSIF